MRITRTVPAALAAVAVAMSVPAAQAQPPDMHASVARAAAQSRASQDLRSPDARDAATPKVDAATMQRPSIPVAKPQPVNPAPTAGGSGIDPTTIVLGIAAALLAVAGFAALGTRRGRRLRATA